MQIQGLASSSGTERAFKVITTKRNLARRDTRARAKKKRKERASARANTSGDIFTGQRERNPRGRKTHVPPASAGTSSSVSRWLRERGTLPLATCIRNSWTPSPFQLRPGFWSHTYTRFTHNSLCRPPTHTCAHTHTPWWEQ